MFKGRKRTIKHEFFYTGLLSAMLISMVFIVILSMTIYEDGMENARQKLKSSNVHLFTYTDGVLESLAMSTNISAFMPEVMQYEGGDLTARKKVLELFRSTTLANPNIKFAFAGYENGELLIENYTPPKGFDARTRPWYIAAVEKYPKISLGVPYQDASTQEWLVSVSHALVDESGELKGVVAVDCTLEYVIDLMAEVQYYESQSNFVLDSNNMVFVHENTDFLHLAVDSVVPGFSELITDKSGYINYTLGNSNRLAYYQRHENSNWIVVSAIDVSEVTRPLNRRIGSTVVGLLALAVILGLVQVKLYERSFVKPITALSERIGEITSGKKVSLSNDSYSNQELAEIARRIESMAETSLRKKADELQLILNTTSDGILVLDLEGNVIHANQKLLNMWQVDEFAKVADISNPLLREQVASYSGGGDGGSDGGKYTKLIHLSEEMILEQFSCPLTADGKVSGRLWSYRNVTEQINAEENLRNLATTDGLTGVWNRRMFMTQGAYEIELVKRTGLPLSLIFLDVDFFKTINDTYGHAVGDEVLIFLTSSIKSHIRSTDYIARLGGEEFCILAPNTDLNAARILAEKLRVFFESHWLDIEQKRIQLTLSLGVSSYMAPGGSIDDLLNLADKACYSAKAQGRNRVVTVPPSRVAPKEGGDYA